MKNENMFFTEIKEVTMTFDKITTIVIKKLESVDENGIHILKGYSTSKTVKYISENSNQMTERAA